MRRAAWIRGALGVASALGISLLLPGCFADTCWDLLECPQPGATLASPAPSCDPAAGGISAACAGVYVSGALGDDANEGSAALPVRTLGKALEVAQRGSRRVYACAERFIEAQVIASGVEIWGGLDCAAGWSYVGETRKTILAPDAGAIPLRIVAGTGRATIADVRAEAADAVLPGGSSIAVSVAAGAAVDIVRCELIAGRGAAGAPGRGGGELPAEAGEDGAPGGEACSAGNMPGGAGAIHVCGGVTSVGGQGGSGGISQGGSGTAGAPEPIPNPGGAGLGGTGEDSMSLCEHAVPGARGLDGVHGLGARGAGSFTSEGWLGIRGEDGAFGRPGQGGGGGGGARGGVMRCGANLGGASGGGGGGGGCGGRGGTGGGAGGASIGLLTLSGDVTLRSFSIFTGGGGHGGAGGRGQQGGLGGGKGPRGTGVNMALPACDGGDGGPGGDGGHAGGGLGGPSIGILYMDGHAPGQLDLLDLQVGPAGLGGPGGDPAHTGLAGDDGLRGESLGFPP